MFVNETFKYNEMAKRKDKIECNEEIRISSQIKSELGSEFRVTKQTVQMALSYVNMSDKAKEIRLGARRELLREVDSIDRREPNLNK